MDCVEVTMIGNQDIIVALAGCNWEPSCLVRLILPVRSTFLRKTRLVSSDFVDGGNWSCFWSGSYWVTFSFFDLRTFWGSWRCPSMVDCFWINICEPGQMIGLTKKWNFYCDFFPPSRLIGAPAGCVVIIHQCTLWILLVGVPHKIFGRSCGLRH